MAGLLFINKAKEESHPKSAKNQSDSEHSGLFIWSLPVLLKRPGHEIPLSCHYYQQTTVVFLATGSAQLPEEPCSAAGLGSGTLRLWMARLQPPVGKQLLVASLGSLTERSTWLSEKQFLIQNLSCTGK